MALFHKLIVNTGAEDRKLASSSFAEFGDMERRDGVYRTYLYLSLGSAYDLYRAYLYNIGHALYETLYNASLNPR